MRSALVQGLGVSEDCIEIDYGSKVVSVREDGVTPEAIDKAFEGTRYARLDS